MANASIIVLCMRSSHDPAMNRSQCRWFSLRAGTGITSHSAHPRAPIGSHIQNVSVDPIQLSSGIVSPQKRITSSMRFSRMAIEILSQLGTDCSPKHYERVDKVHLLDRLDFSQIYIIIEIRSKMQAFSSGAFPKYDIVKRFIMFRIGYKRRCLPRRLGRASFRSAACYAA